MMHRLAALLLSLCLALTSVTAAMAHVQSAGAHQIVLCGTPGIEETITLNAFGDPVETPHHCPDCLSVTALVLPDAPALARPATQRRTVPPAPVAWAPLAQALIPTARGPPVLI